MALLFCSCQQEESFLFESKASLYMTGRIGGAANTLTYDYDMAFQIMPRVNDWDIPVYYGDNLRTDTIQLEVHLLGETSDEAREYSLKSELLEDQDSTMVAEVEFFNPYVLESGRMKDTVEVVIHRPAKRGIHKVGITFDVSDPNGDFEGGAVERSVFELTVRDQYPRPVSEYDPNDFWDDATSQYGPYTEEKYAFMVTVIGATYNIYGWEWSGTYYLDILKEALREYNATHDVPKDFTFPGM